MHSRIMIRGHKERLYLTPEQTRLADQTASACRAVYNLALEQRNLAYRDFGVSVSLGAQGLEIKELRAAFPWIAEVPYDCLTQSLRDLDVAFQRFFKKTAGHPRFKSRNKHHAFRFPKGHAMKITRTSNKWAEVNLPKMGQVRFRITDFPRRIRIRVQSPAGRLYIGLRTYGANPRQNLIGICPLSTSSLLSYDNLLYWSHA